MSEVPVQGTGCSAMMFADKMNNAASALALSIPEDAPEDESSECLESGLFISRKLSDHLKTSEHRIPELEQEGLRDSYVHLESIRGNRGTLNTMGKSTIRTLSPLHLERIRGKFSRRVHLERLERSKTTPIALIIRCSSSRALNFRFSFFAVDLLPI